MALLDEWTSRWASQDSEWSVVSDTDFHDDAKLELSAGSRTRRALSFDNLGTPADVEVFTETYVPVSSGSRARTVLRGGSTSGNENGYFLTTSDDTWRIQSYDSDGSARNLASWGTVSDDTYYYTRFRVNGTTNLKAKVWKRGTPEPSSWDAEVSDGQNEHSSGWAGVASFEQSDAWGYFSAETTGGTAYSPVTSVSESTTADWDSSQYERGIRHEQPAGTDFNADDVLSKGYATRDFWDGSLEFYFPFDEDSGTTANEVVAGNDATNNGATVGSDGILGTTSYTFDRANTDYVQVNSTVDYGIANGTASPFTIIGWIYWTGSTSNSEGVYQHNDPNNISANNPPMGLYIDSGPLRFMIQDTTNSFNGATESGTMPQNQWVHVAGTYNSSGDMTLYRDGVEIATGTAPDIANVGAQPEFGVWKRSTGRYMSGRLDEWQLYSREFSAAQINEHMEITR